MLHWVGILLALNAVAETGYKSQDEIIRQMQAQTLIRQMEADLANPKKPKLDKKRAIHGSPTAPILIVAYSDFQCPYCKAAAQTVQSVKKKYGKKVAFQFKHLPLNFHPMALPAAKRFEAIALQSSSKAYAFHDAVFESQQRLGTDGEAFLDETATKVGADLEKMKKDLDSEAVTKRLEEDAAEAKGFNMSGTPGFIVAGVQLNGAYPAEVFDSIIEERLKPRTVSNQN